MKTIAILDTETSSLDPSTGSLLEIAVARFSLEHGALIDVASWLVIGESNEAEAVNGIPVPLLSDGLVLRHAFERFADYLTGVDAVVAHNAAFDRQWFPHEYQWLTWICSCDDIEWPRKTSSRSLTAIALAHGVGVVDAHRATADVLTLARLFARVHEMGVDLSAMLARAARPKVRVVSLAPYDEREWVKAHGFRWDAARRVWWRNMQAEDVAALPFRTRIDT